MNKRNLLTVLAIALVAAQCGCSAKLGRQTGFLSDYTKLDRQSDISYRYIGPYLGRYSQFIVDPVKVHFHASSKAGKLSAENITDMQNYMHAAIVSAISDRYSIVYRPGPGVARIRVALTDLKKSKIVQNIWPGSKLAGTGLGGASLEAELVDSRDGTQIGAVVESQLGERLSLDGLSTWGDVKAIMDGWAKRLRERLDEAHGRL
jgi:hypothetical protein